jgi:hypothetical protein
MSCPSWFFPQIPFSEDVDSYLRKYPGLLLGFMAAAGLIKVGALLWQEKFSAWPLLSVLVVPLALAGLALGLGVGHDRLVSSSVARRLAPVGGLLLLAVPPAAVVLGGDGGLFVAATAGPVGLGLLGPRLAHPDGALRALLRGRDEAEVGHSEGHRWTP